MGGYPEEIKEQVGNSLVMQIQYDDPKIYFNLKKCLKEGLVLECPDDYFESIREHISNSKMFSFPFKYKKKIG